MRRFFLLFPLFALLLACAGLMPPSPGVPEAQYEKGLRFSEKEYSQPIDILKGVWNPADSAREQSLFAPENPSVPDRFRIQIILLGSKKRALAFQNRIKKQFPQSHFFVLRRGKYWAVQVGPFATRVDAARTLKSTWRKKFPDAWIVRAR